MGRNSLCPLEVKRWNKNKWERHPASWISQQRNKDKFLLLSSDMCCLFLFYYRTYIWDKYIQGVFSCAKFWKSANVRLSGRLAVMNVKVGLFTLWFLSEITTAVTSKLTDSNIRMVMSKLRWLVDNRHCTMLELLVTGESWISMFSTYTCITWHLNTVKWKRTKYWHSQDFENWNDGKNLKEYYNKILPCGSFILQSKTRLVRVFFWAILYTW